MKLSLVKLPALYGFMYAVFITGVMVAAALSLVVQHQFSLPACGDLLFTWTLQWWWLNLVGAALHVLSYAKSLTSKMGMVANTLGVCVYIAYALIPNYSPVILVVHLLALALLMRSTRRRLVSVEG
ncbi:hypothetical protein [Lacticaseibacillus yichunensis]|uniref:Uncharacterized protein n=1 Tax=Lacticaseibacillus yichunensis TaxID=2486015 RepID=A0ABW4CLM4_9LACO|nr:hypothetical protein [Lacticaseibacillus yichunensis]